MMLSNRTHAAERVEFIRSYNIHICTYTMFQVRAPNLCCPLSLLMHARAHSKPLFRGVSVIGIYIFAASGAYVQLFLCPPPLL